MMKPGKTSGNGCHVVEELTYSSTFGKLVSELASEPEMLSGGKSMLGGPRSRLPSALMAYVGLVAVPLARSAET